MKLRLLDEGVLYCNPLPGHQALNAIYPVIVPLTNRHVLGFCRLGQALYSLDGRVHVLRSRDAGKTWKHEGPIVPPDRRERGGPYSYGTTWTTRHADGTLVQQTCRYPSEPRNLIRFHPVTGGHRPDEQVYFLSRDDGRTWSGPNVYEISRRRIVDTHSSIIELNDGRWMQIFETWKSYASRRPLHITGLALFSSDRGRTWGGQLTFPSARDRRRMYSHSQYRKLSDGRIAATQWTQDIGGQVNHDLHLTFGDPTGRHWTQPAPTGLPGQSSCIGEIRPGVLVCTYTLRYPPHPGIMVALSTDGGRTWKKNQQVRVWDCTGADKLGTRHPPRYPASHDNASFGKPDTAILPDGTVISSWWCTFAGITHVRYARLAAR
jgi:hypothetical protein